MVRLSLGLLLLITSAIGYGQDIGIPIIKNFSPEEYNAEPQNWQITQCNQGLIHIANNSGLLEFDGVSWRMIDVPKNVARSVDVSKDGRVFVGTIGDLGYIDFNEKGKQVFVSLLNKIPKEFRDFVDVWRTSATSDGIYFKTNRYIFLWDGKQFITWPAPKAYAFSFVVNNDFYVKEDSTGLNLFRNKKLTKLPSGHFFKKMDIRSILSYDAQSLLISTLEHGMYKYFYDGKIEPFKTQADDFLKRNLIFASSKTNNDCLAFGTFRGGLILMNKQGKILKTINEESGIRENSIRAMCLDREGSLWLALNNGISRIEVNSPITVFDKRKNIKGSVYQVNRNESTLFIGTSVGLNYIDPKQGEVKSIENFADQVWNLYSLPGEQLLGTNASSYSLRNLKISFINNSGGSFTFLQSKKDGNRVFVGKRDGLQSIYKSAGQWQVENDYPEIKGQIRSIHEDKHGGVWLNSSLLGLVHIRFSDGYAKPVYKYFSAKDGVPVNDRFKFISLNDEFFIFLRFKFYQYDSANKKFSEAAIHINGDLPSDRESYNLTSDNNGNQIVWSNVTVGYLKKQGPKEYQWDPNPFLRIRDKAINYAFTDDDSLVWIGSANGLYRIDLAKENKTLNSFDTQLRSVSEIDSDSIIYSGQEVKKDRRLSYEFNKLRFQFASSFFDQSDETEYQTFLEGSDEGWSSWSTNTKKDYTNLWEGTYTFHVRSKNIYHVLGKEAQFSFIIAPPWYRTKTAYVFYLFGVANLFYFGVRAYYNSLKRTNKRLEGLVEMRTSKINLQKEEIESQRDNLVHAHQTIEKQNNELLRMNHELEKIVEERTSALTKSNTELIEVNKELDRFVYRAAHDLRGPVATLLGLCNLSLMETKDHSAIEYLSKIQLTAERLNFLLFMLLKINRIKTQEITVEPIDIKRLVKTIYISLMANYKDRPNIKVLTWVDPQIEMRSDPSMVSIILENLIDNALKFTRPEVEPEININIKKNGDRVNIIITDNGIGIAEEYRSKIFDMFFIGTAERKGLGLGLHAVQMAAKKLNGTVKLIEGNSNLTQFLVDIPEKI